MPTAAIADIHGNVHALEAVLADPRLTAADEIVVLGDIVAGTFPAETFDAVVALGPRARILGGNADRIVLEDDIEEAHWARALLGPDRLAAVQAWPKSFTIDVEGLGAVLCCHATPRSDDEIVTRITPEPDFAAALEGTAESVILAGHTHIQFDRTVGPHRFVNVGSVGRPYEGVPGAYWALLGPEIELLHTEYDVESAVEAVRRSGQPTAERVIDTLLHPPPPDEATAHWEAARA